MSDPSQNPGVYNPFPSFADWAPADFDTEAFDRYGELFALDKASSTPELRQAAMDTAMRYAAVDTNAIEGIYATDRGFTRTVATQAAAWEAAMAARGDHVRPAFEDALNGYEYVLDATTNSVPITEVWIRELHQILCSNQANFTVYTNHGPQERPLAKGVYKSMPNSPTLLDGRVHAYAPVADTPAEMGRFVDELRTEAFLSAHPVLQAAYAHYAYVCVHPFSDGNGRVARALASAYLYRAPGVPLVIFADQRNAYYDALEQGDSGTYEGFVQFVGARALDALGIMRLILRRSAPPVSESLLKLNSIFNVDAHDDELRAAAIRLRLLCYAEIQKQVQELTLPAQMKGSLNPNQIQTIIVENYRTIGREGGFYFVVDISWPVQVRVRRNFAVLVRMNLSAPSDLVATTGDAAALEVSLSELVPVETETLRLKMQSWVEGVLAAVFAEVEAKASAGLA